ncbi:hypothetical protein APHAL10511_008258 [Amanita phalloides]|nr:hypothetical protein APHAL10511_008258 [Amanita phalloides]
MSLAYHSAATAPSPLGRGWVIKGVSLIERVPATLAQDNFRGVVNYSANDRFALDGQRLMKVGENEYRFEVEQWSKLIAKGSDPSNPDSWEQYLPDGRTRFFGTTPDSNIKALGTAHTRVWAVSEIHDAFSNYTSFAYDNDTTNGSFYLSQISSGGNLKLSMDHQRKVNFTYEDRPDKRTMYFGGYKIRLTKRLAFFTSYVQSKLVHTHHLQYDISPLNDTSRLRSLTLTDPHGSSVRPLNFDWIDGQPSVFDPTRTVKTVDATLTGPDVLPIDVYATGCSDLVIASKSLNDQEEEVLDLTVYKADGKGNVSDNPAPGFGTTGLPYPINLLPMDVDGDGKVDLPQQSLVFKPEGSSGRFYPGDFEGNGYVGLVYVYEVMPEETTNLKFVQFTSDGSQFTASEPRSGPSNQTFAGTKVIVGDFNGNGAQDVFLVSEALQGGTSYYRVDLIESKEGKLTYREDDPFASCSGKILSTESSSVLPFAADNDSKTSLLFIFSDAEGKLQMQTMRSTSVTLLPDSHPTVTNAHYDGDVTISSATSTNAVNLLNVDNTVEGIKLDVFVFDGEHFNPISSVRQPEGVATGSIVSWGDLRGIGRVDCLISTSDVSGTFTVRSMPCCSSNSQPIDYISNYENGLGATVSALYAPLSDSSTYTTTSSVPAVTNTAAAVNAMARNSASSKRFPNTRSEIVHFPSFVVKQLSVCPRAAHPDVRKIQVSTYTNARLDFTGRGWLGFESISKTRQPIGVTERTIYFQEFPFLGQASGITSHEVSGNKLLQSNEYPWQLAELNKGKNVLIRLPRLREKFYEAGVHSHDIDVAFEYDNFANILTTSITSSQGGISPLFIRSTFANDTVRWVLGSKTSEIVEQNDTTLRKTEYTYVPGTHIPNMTKKWVVDSKWSSQVVRFDEAGNKISVQGPKSSRQEFKYDETYSFRTSTLTFTNSSHALRENAIYDLALGKPLSITDANGFVTLREYDVLGRLLTVSEGDEKSTSVVQRRFFHFKDGEFFDEHLRSTGLGNDTWAKVVSYMDGLKRVWKTEKSRPDDLSKSIYSISKYDGAGRLIARSRDSLDIKGPLDFTTYEYDTRSRVVRKVSPPITPGASSATTEYQYEPGKTTERRLEGKSSLDQVTVRKISYLPIPGHSAGHFVKEFVTEIISPLHEHIQMAYDGLGRSATVTDASGVQLKLIYDGLSRQISRRLQTTAGENIKTVSHFTVLFDDDNSQTTVRNELTGSAVESTADFAGRVIKQTTADETISFVYDDDAGTFTKGRLFKASSSKGYDQQFDYNLRGQILGAQLHIDHQSYATSSEWTTAGQLIKTTNPDGTIITHKLLPDGKTVGEIVLTDGNVQASTLLSGYDNPFRRPLSCQFGNGIVSKSTIIDNGALETNALTSKNGNGLLQQNWKFHDSGLIEGYKVHKTDDFPTVPLRDNIFEYDANGQLISDTTDLTVSSFSYDQGGNLSSKYGRTFVNDGWQLATAQNPDGSQSLFEYSVDGNLTSEKDSFGSPKRTMKYDTQNRLIEMNGTTFTYDFLGQLIKAASPKGEVTIYPSQTYEARYSSGSLNVCHTAYIIHGYRRACLTHEKDEVGDAKIYYFHNDHLGSTIAASDVSGKIVTAYRYDTFGKVNVQGPDVARYKFQGKELFGSVYYFGARFYDPDLGRFLTLDNFPISLNQLTSSTFNMYSFARNDPINFIDFNGNVPWWHWFVDAVAIVAGAVLTFVPGPWSIVGAGLLGAGTNSLLYDIDHVHDRGDDGAWAIQFGIGAGIGLISGGLGFGANALADWAIDGATDVASDVVSDAASDATLNKVTKVALKVVLNSVVGGFTNMAGQAISNAMSHVPLSQGMGEAFISGLSAGFSGMGNLGTAASDFATVFVPIVEDSEEKDTKEKTGTTPQSSTSPRPVSNPLPGVGAFSHSGAMRKKIHAARVMKF